MYSALMRALSSGGGNCGSIPLTLRSPFTRFLKFTKFSKNPLKYLCEIFIPKTLCNYYNSQKKLRTFPCRSDFCWGTCRTGSVPVREMWRSHWWCNERLFLPASTDYLAQPRNFSASRQAICLHNISVIWQLSEGADDGSLFHWNNFFQ